MTNHDVQGRLEESLSLCRLPLMKIEDVIYGWKVGLRARIIQDRRCRKRGKKGEKGANPWSMLGRILNH